MSEIKDISPRHGGVNRKPRLSVGQGGVALLSYLVIKDAAGVPEGICANVGHIRSMQTVFLSLAHKATIGPQQ